MVVDTSEGVEADSFNTFFSENEYGYHMEHVPYL